MKIIESYRKLSADQSFDLYFLQEQGPKAIFGAAYDLIRDYLFTGNVMLTSPDFKELLNLFKKHTVKYLIVGGYAAMRYTEPRFTKDLDL